MIIDNWWRLLYIVTKTFGFLLHGILVPSAYQTIMMHSCDDVMYKLLILLTGFICLFVPYIYKLAPLWGTPWNMPCSLRGSWAMLLEDRRVTILYICPVGAKIAPDILSWGTETPLYIVGVMQIPLTFQAVQNIAKIVMRTPGWLGWMLRPSTHIIVVDCRNAQKHGALQ